MSHGCYFSMVSSHDDLGELSLHGHAHILNQQHLITNLNGKACQMFEGGPIQYFHCEFKAFGNHRTTHKVHSL